MVGSLPRLKWDSYLIGIQRRTGRIGKIKFFHPIPAGIAIQKKILANVLKYEISRIFIPANKMQLKRNSMKKKNSFRLAAISGCCLFLACFIMAFQDSTKVNIPQKQALLDSPPGKTTFSIELDLRDMDKALQQSMEAVEKSMKAIDMEKIGKDIEKSIKAIDMDKIQANIKNAMNNIDLDKIRIEVDRSKVDVDKIKINMDKMKDEMQLAMKEFNSDAWKKSMEEMKKTNFDDLKKEMEKVKQEMEANKSQFKIEMDKARLEVLKAKEGLNELKGMMSEMEKDGLINKNETNTIEYKDKDLYINGKKQSPEASSKYQKYFKGEHFKFQSDK